MDQNLKELQDEISGIMTNNRHDPPKLTALLKGIELKVALIQMQETRDLHKQRSY